MKTKKRIRKEKSKPWTLVVIKDKKEVPGDDMLAPAYFRLLKMKTGEKINFVYANPKTPYGTGKIEWRTFKATAISGQCGIPKKLRKWLSRPTISIEDVHTNIERIVIKISTKKETSNAPA